MTEQHTLTQFDTDLDELNGLIMSMFKIVRKNIKRSLKALATSDIELANKVIRQDEAVNALEVQADEAARNLIVRHQPAGSDLRFVFAVTKIITDLERMGDLAANIAENVVQIKGESMEKATLVPAMQGMVIEQIKRVRKAYIQRDVAQAQQIIERDEIIDHAFDNIRRALLTYMAESPSSISVCLALTNIARILERIGDHATNIAEMVIYAAVGHEVRHIDPEQLREMLVSDEDDEDDDELNYA